MLFPERSFFQKIVDYLKGKPKARNFRDMGLGNVLLQSIVGEAREYGVRNIQGTVGHSDRLETPFLVQWCAKNGFREISRKPGHPRNAEVLMGINL